MKQSQIIFGFLFPSRQDATKPVHPAMRPFHYPATSFESSLMLNSLCLFATRMNMSSIAKLFYQVSYLTRIITFIKAHALKVPQFYSAPPPAAILLRPLQYLREACSCHFKGIPVPSLINPEPDLSKSA